MDKLTVKKISRIYLIANALGLKNFNIKNKEDLLDLKYYIEKTIMELDLKMGKEG